MEILGVGIPEMAFIVLLALILLGPKEMIAASKTIGKALRKFLMSPTWQALRKTGEELQQLPTKLVREAGLDEIQSEIQDMAQINNKTKENKKPFDEANVFEPNMRPASESSQAISQTIKPPAPETSGQESGSKSASEISKEI